MGFIKYNGNKEDHYTEILEYAKFNEEVQQQKYYEELRRSTDAEYFGVQNLRNLSTEDLLRKVALSFHRISVRHARIIVDSRTDFYDIQQYEDLWLYTISTLLESSTLTDERKYKISDLLIQRIFRLNSRTEISEHYLKKARDTEYSNYLNSCFGIEIGDKDYYWQWMGTLDKSEARIMLDEFSLIFRTLAFYLNQVMPSQGIGIKIMETWEQRMRHLARKVASDNKTSDLQRHLVNPIYTKVTDKQDNANGNIYTRCSRVIIGDHMNINQNDSVTAFYNQYACGKIKGENIASILSEQCRKILREGRLPVIDGEMEGLGVGEAVHYMEHGIIYNAMDANCENFQAVHGDLIITSESVRFKSVNMNLEINHKDIRKITLYDSSLSILELKTAGDTLLINTASTVETYEFLRVINNGFLNIGESIKDMERISTEDFKQDSLDAYVFTIKSLNDASLPDEMKIAIERVVESISSLSNALKQYPSEAEQSYKFGEYYIPEIINLINSYIEYNKAKVSEKNIALVYSKIMKSIQGVIVAIDERINDIYKFATMTTKAKADTVIRILGQDGLV